MTGASDSHNPPPVSDDARDVVWELEAENARLREALEAITHWWKGDAPLDGEGTSWRPDIVARAALDGIKPSEVAREALEAGER